ncbi:MAG: hypothetical protein HFH09_01150 [Bacilli bacterium]|nr:hypothetical protein [Bacilli bacterium]
MKKLILLFLMFFPIFSVSAAEWKEVETIPVISGGTLEIKEEKEYQWYRIKKEGGYFKEAPSKEFKKTSFWTFGPWSDWQEEYPNGKENVESKNVYHYQLMQKIKYIRLSEINSSNLIFASIQIYKDRDQISYKMEELDNEIILELEDPCYFDELEVEMTLVNEFERENAFFIEWLYELDLPSCMQTYTRQWFSISTQISFIERKMMPNQFLYEEEKASLERVEENSHTKVSKKEYYRYQERLYYFEKEVKEYSREFSGIMIEGYPYPDFKTERKRLFCRIEKKDPEIKEIPVEKVIPIEKIVLKEQPLNHLLEQDNIFLKREVKNLKYRIASCQNEKSENLEKNKSSKIVEVKKQSLEATLYVVTFLFGYLLGRIVTTKKKI